MSVFKNGNWYWFEFTFHGVRHRKPTKTDDKATALRLEAEYRRQLELGQLGLKPVLKNQKLFGVEAKAYMELMQPHWKPATRKMHKCSFPHVVKFFGKKVLSEITVDTISRYIIHRQGQLTVNGAPPSNRTINIELTLVRQVLIKHKLWSVMREGTDFNMLRENSDVGRALDREEIQRLLEACRQSTNRSLYAAVMLSIFTGLRSCELLPLRWNQIDFLKRTLTVGISKTKAGQGRVVSLSDGAMNLLTNYRTGFAALPDHAVFPSYKAGKRNPNPKVTVTKLFRPWDDARKLAGVECRWHDLRHSCVSIVAEGGASDATLKAMFGWMSDRMIARYSHSREQARKQAVQHLDGFMGNILEQKPERESIQ